MNSIQILKKTHARLITFFSLLMAVLLSLLVSLIFFSISILSGTITFISLSIFIFFIIKKKNIANGEVDFIDLDNKSIYLIERGFRSFTHKKIHFNKWHGLKLITVPPRIRHQPRFFKIFALIDEDEILIFQTRNRRVFNRIAQRLIEQFNPKISFKRDTFLSEDSGYSFENTSYNYNSTPGTYLASAILSSPPLLLMASIDTNNKSIFQLVLPTALAIYIIFSLKQYIGSKADLKNQNTTASPKNEKCA